MNQHLKRKSSESSLICCYIAYNKNKKKKKNNKQIKNKTKKQSANKQTLYRSLPMVLNHSLSHIHSSQSSPNLLHIHPNYVEVLRNLITGLQENPFVA
jgi:hypothetical protein